jgi:dTDP-4-dehydrorhamnose 3,5-epimerase
MANVDILSGVKEIVHDSFQDNRGQLFTLWNQLDLPNISFNHDKVAISKKNVLRGLHADKAWKLITCLHGKIQLVVVNFKQDSSEYLDHQSIILDSNSNIKTTILVPPRFLNGHLVLSNEAIFYYKWAYEGDYPDVDDQLSINWCDPKIGIKWLVDKPVLSERDQKSPLL